MSKATQRTSNIAALVLAVIALSYIFLPAEYFVGLLIVVPLVALSITAWIGSTFRGRDDRMDQGLSPRAHAMSTGVQSDAKQLGLLLRSADLH